MDLAATLAGHVESGAIAGLAALVGHDAEVLDVAVLGSATLGGDALRRDAIFRIASVTKPIVAVLAMQLVDDGVVHLEDPVDALLPELAGRRVLTAIDGALDDTVPAERAITLEDLLSLRFGFGFAPDLPFDGSTPVQRAEAELELKTLGPPWPPGSIDNDEWIRRLGTLPLMAQPGSTWMYNTGMQVTGVLLERATGVPLEDLLGERLFAPLGMVDTGFSVPPGEVHRLTAQYAGDPLTGALKLVDPGDASSWWAVPPAKPEASGGLVSTLDDVWAFGRMMACGGVHDGQRLISPQSFEMLTTNRLSEPQRAASTLFLGESSGWGLGMGTPLDATGTFGWEGGTGTSLRTQPSTGTTAIILTQREMGGPHPPTVFEDLWSVAWGATDR